MFEFNQHDILLVVAGAALEYFVGVFSRVLAKKPAPVVDVSKAVKV